MDEVEDGEEDMSTGVNFHPLKCQKTWHIFPGIWVPILQTRKHLKIPLELMLSILGRNFKLVKKKIIREFVCVVLEHKDTVNGMHIVGSYPQQDVGS